MKARTTKEVKKFQDIPNVGPVMTRDFISLGIKEPDDLKTQKAFTLYRKLCQLSGTRQDPCVLDTYMAVVDFMNGAPARHWWHYTEIRKRGHPNL